MAALLTFLALATLQAPPDPDPRWQAFLGCWQATPTESEPAHATEFDVTGKDEETEAREADPVICIAPSGDGVVITTLGDGERTEPRALRPGSGPVSEGGCRGVETTAWSSDGQRLLLGSQLECTGGLQRSSHGILALTGRAALVDVQSVSVAGEDAVRVVRYRLLDPTEFPQSFALDPEQALARETARVHAARPLALESLVETHRAVGAAALEALLAARRAGYALDGATLVRLADAGLPPSTLDVLIALSYPEHFEVVEERPRERVASAGVDRWGRYDPWNSWGYSRYGCYGYSAYYYSPYACDRYGWGRGTGWIYVVPAGGSEGQSSARAVKGRGYTRGDAPTTGTARPRISPSVRDRAGTTGRGASPARGTRDGDRANPSTGDGSDRPARQAKPRGGG